MKVVVHPAIQIRDELEQLKRRQEALEGQLQSIAAILYQRQRRESKLLTLLDRVMSLLRHDDDDR
jgi:hypothetical protein